MPRPTPPSTSLPLDVVFEGGGARGLALNGAVRALDEGGYTLRRLVGTSAGAWTAALITVGYTGRDLWEMSLETTPGGRSRMTEFLGLPAPFSPEELAASELGAALRRSDIPLVPAFVEDRLEAQLLEQLARVPMFAHLLALNERGGYHSPDGVTAWLREKLDARGKAYSAMTLGELYAETGRDLSLITTDTTESNCIVLNHRTAPGVPLLWAVRMSSNIPFLWPELAWQAEWGPYRGHVDLHEHAMVDGGVIANFGLRFLVSQEDWVVELMGRHEPAEAGVLGLWLDGKTAIPDLPPRIRGGAPFDPRQLDLKMIERLERILSIALHSSDIVELRNHEDLVCSLPVGGLGMLELDMSQARILALLHAGSNAIQCFLRERATGCDAPHPTGGA